MHPPELGDGDMAFINDEEKVLRKIIKEGRGRFSGHPPAQVPRVVFYPMAVSDLLDHFQIKISPLLNPLRLNQLVLAFKVSDPFCQFYLDGLNGPLQPGAGYDIMGARIDRCLGEAVYDASPEGVSF